MWYGAVCPWEKFLANDVVPLPRLVALGILVLLLRRLPWVFAIHRRIPQIEEVHQAIFVGFFGPIGVSAIFYLYIANEFLDTLKGADGELRGDVANLPEAVLVVVWFLCVCSVVSTIFYCLLTMVSLLHSTLLGCIQPRHSARSQTPNLFQLNDRRPTFFFFLLLSGFFTNTPLPGCPRSQHPPREARLLPPTNDIPHRHRRARQRLCGAVPHRQQGQQHRPPPPDAHHLNPQLPPPIGGPRPAPRRAPAQEPRRIEAELVAIRVEGRRHHHPGASKQRRWCRGRGRACGARRREWEWERERERS